MHMIYKVILTACLSILFTTTVSAATVGLFPTSLSENTTGQNDSYFLGSPDGLYWGLGGQFVTYDFGTYRVINEAGQDFNVYEINSGGEEFGSIDVLASLDGVTFYNISGSQDTYVPIIGDNNYPGSFSRSYDLPDVLTEARYIRIDGKGSDPAGASIGFDLTAIGAIHYGVAIVPLPPSVFLFLSSLLGLVFLRKKS